MDQKKAEESRLCLNVLHSRPGSRGMRSSRRPPALSPQLCRFSEYKANTVQAVQATRQKPLFLPPSPKGDEETVEISASPSLRREQYSSASMAEWTTETTITSASSSICRSPPAAPAQHQHQKHQASPVFASKALPTRRQRGEKHKKNNRLTSSFTKFDSFLGCLRHSCF